MADPRRIALVTTTRADWGILAPLAQVLADADDVALSIVAGGAHLSAHHGVTHVEIQDDGFDIDYRVPMRVDGSNAERTRGLGQALAGFGDAFEELKPDLVVVLGDRYELLAAASAATMARIPIAHLHGGEASEGQFDEQIRHAVSKLAHLHFPAAAPYAARLIGMGENPLRVHQVGSLAVETIRNAALPSRKALFGELGLDPALPVFAITYHPVTLAEDHGAFGARGLVDAVRRFGDAQLVVTGTNADPGAEDVACILASLPNLHPGKVVVEGSLGHKRYLGLVKHSTVVIGNSSSGIIEAPALGVPAVNIGPRQDGRLRAPAVIDCGETGDEIAAAISKALSLEMNERAALGETPYAKDGTAQAIAEVLRTVPLEGLLIKRFYEGDAAATGRRLVS